jgi:hypothetical protein
MKKLLYSVLLLGSLASIVNSCEPNTVSGATVYICTGPSSTKYHNRSNCSCLNSCSTAISSVSLSSAQSMGRTQCGCCY